MRRGGGGWKEISFEHKKAESPRARGLLQSRREDAKRSKIDFALICRFFSHSCISSYTVKIKRWKDPRLTLP